MLIDPLIVIRFFLARKIRDFLLSYEMGFGKTTESTEDTEKTATLCVLRVLCG
jgi:hypothetical protein